MRPSKSVAALATLLVILSYSITVACDHSTDQSAAEVQTVKVISEADAGSVDVVVTCERLEEALTCGVFAASDRASTSLRSAMATHSIRAGIGVARAISRALAHTTVVMARTAYHAVVALT